jgi:hypothetical protein
MSDPATAMRRKPSLSFLVAGLASGLLFLSFLLSVAFLLPVQIAFGRRGWRGGLAAAGVSAAAIATVLAAMTAASGGFAAQGSAGSAIVSFAQSLALPVLLLCALILANAPFLRRWDRAYATLAATALCALVAIPALLSAERDGVVAGIMEKQMGEVLSPVRDALSDPSGGYEASVLAAALDPKNLIATSFAILRNSVAAIAFALLAASRWLGSRMSGRGSRAREESPALGEVRLPYAFLWAFLASWTCVLVIQLTSVPPIASTIAWNCALTVSLAYAAVGLGIVAFLLKKWNTPKSLRISLAALAVIAMLTPVGIAIAVTLPLIGVTEIWIHYRKPKGVGI